MEGSDSPPSVKPVESRGRVLEPLANRDTPLSARPLKSLSPEPLPDILTLGRAPRKLPPILSRSLLDTLRPQEDLPNGTADGLPALETAPTRNPSLPRFDATSPKKEIVRTSALMPKLRPLKPQPRSLQKPPPALPQDKDFVEVLTGEPIGDGDGLPPLPRIDSLVRNEDQTHPPIPPVSSIAPTTTPRLSKMALFNLIAIPLLVVVNIFLIVFIVVPAFSGSVGSSTGNIDILGVVSVIAADGRVGVGQPNPQAQFEVFKTIFLIILLSFF